MAELNFEEALEYWQRCLAVWRRTDDKHSAMIALANLALPSMRLGNFVDARTYNQEALALARELRNRHAEGIILNNLVEIDLHNEDLDAAEVHALQALQLAHQSETTRDIPSPIDNLALCASMRGDLPRAIMLIGFTDAFRKAHNIVLNSDEQTNRTRDLGSLYEVIAEPDYARCYAQGQVMSLDQVVVYVITYARPTPQTYRL